MDDSLKAKIFQSLQTNITDGSLAAITSDFGSAQVEQMETGYLNLVVRVTSGDGAHACIVKVFLPHALFSGPTIPLEVTRCQREYEASCHIHAAIPQCSQVPYFCDNVNNILCIPDLPKHQLWQTGLMESCDLHLGAKVVDAIVSLHSQSHVTRLDPQSFANLKEQFRPLPQLMDLQYSYTYVKPFQPNHRENKPLDEKVRSKLDEVIQDDVVTKARELASDWLRPENAACLIHGDLHTGAVMSCQQTMDVKLIDTECTRMGPEAFDVARLVCNYVLLFHYHQGKSGKEETCRLDHTQLMTDIVDLICITLSRYMEGMNKALDDKFDKPRIWKQILLFMGVELIAWISGPMSIACLEEFPDAQNLCLQTALRLLHRQTLRLDPRGVSQLIHDSR